MKKLLLVICFIALTGCQTFYEHGKFTEYRLIDLGKYLEKGLFITPYSYGGDYDPIAMLDVEVFAAAIKTTDVAGITRIEYGKVNLEEAIDSLYELIKLTDANAVVDFKWHTDKIILNGYNCETITVTGFAIKRKEKL